MRPNHVMLAIITTAIWGCNFVFVALALNDIPPYLLCVLRFLLSSIPIVFFLKKPKAPFKTIFLYGFLTFTLQFSFLFAGMNLGMPPGLTSLIFQSQVFFSMFLALLFLNEKPNRMQVIGAIVSFSGLALVWFKYANTTSWIGFLMIIGAAASMGGGNLVSRKLAHTNSLALVAWGSLLALPPLILLSLWLEGPTVIIHSLTNISWTTIGSLTFITYVSTWLGYGLWNKLLRQYEVAAVIPFTLLVPLFGILAASITFHETLKNWEIIAACLIICGLMINVLGSKLLIRRQLSRAAALAAEIEATEVSA